MKLPDKWKRERAASLKSLGMRDYVDYLASPMWARIRRHVYRRADGACESCGLAVPVAIHHWGYALATMKGQNMKALQAVCGPCHRQHHGQRQHDPLVVAKRQARKAFRMLVASGGAVAQQRDMTPRLVQK